ncbi:MAG: hypothetical protein ACLGI2_11235 [Acidimicrobiia bacterium]
MIDRGLLATILLIAAVVAGSDRALRRGRPPAERILAMAAVPLAAGLAVGRTVAVLLDDPSTLRRPLDLVLIRGGMELWPGVAAGAAATWATARREGARGAARLAELAPFGLWAYATYEAMCLVREECFGPMWHLGPVPGGVGSGQFPVAVALGVAVALSGVVAWRVSPRMSPVSLVAASLWAMATARALAAFALPDLASGLTRPHVESLAVASGATLWLAATRIRRRRRGQCGSAAVPDAQPRVRAGSTHRSRPPAGARGAEGSPVPDPPADPPG